MKYTETTEWKDYLELVNKRPALFTKSGYLDIVLNDNIINEYVSKHKVKLGVVYASKWNMMVVDLVRDINGRVFAYERIVPTADGEAVVIIPLIEDRFVLLRQFRHAIRGEQLAFPRGFGENGLTAVQNAAKELKEELDAQVAEDKLKKLGTVCMDSGLTSGNAIVVCAEIDGYDKKIGYEEIEDVVLLTESEIRHMIRVGEITDGFTLAAYEMWRECKE